ncbi:MAG TPA: protein phosphatase CheZ [Steroidobacteraceae bacterium]|jgi:chemotaxis protein CheZ|nr:protein phosphatase CheZ [Steroidobacteraceae bacterium]
MADTQRNLERLRPLLDRLTAAVSAGDATEFERVLDDLVHGRRKDLFAELRRLTARVRQALEAFQLNARFSELAEKDVPDARQRLVHVMKLTDDAAHQTMDLIERATPLVTTLVSKAADPTAPTVVAASTQLRSHLSNVYLAQGYQDLTGQIVRGVIKLVDEVEATLASLMRIAGEATEGCMNTVPDAVNGYGPVVPGVDHGTALGNQQDVDALLSDLGL